MSTTHQPTTPTTSSATFGTATFNELIVKASRFEWARLLWEDSTGRVFLVTSWGAWSYCWTHIGNPTLADFLAGLTKQYACEKFLGNHAYERCHDSTVQAIRETILQDRRCGSLDKAAAQEEWELAQLLADNDIAFDEWMQRSSFDCAYEMARRKLNDGWEGVWEKLWEPLIAPALKKLPTTQPDTE